MDAKLKRFERFNTSGISDAMDKLGVPCQCFGIKPLSLSFKTLGRAFTVKYGPVGTVKGTVGDFIDDVESGQVVVLDNEGRLDATVWGDIMTTFASKRGIAGTVINGVNRDTDRSLELNYPIFGLSNYMRTGKDRVQVEGIQVPVTLGGIRVAQGDIILGDADGVVVIPQELEEKIFEIATEIEDVENRIRVEIDKGCSLREARERYGYHKLQTKTQ